MDYKLLEVEDIPQSVWESAKESLEDDFEEKQVFVGMDVILAFFKVMKISDGLV